MLAVQPGDQSLIPGIHIKVEKEHQLLKVVFRPPIPYLGTSHTHFMHTRKNDSNNISYFCEIIIVRIISYLVLLFWQRKLLQSGPKHTIMMPDVLRIMVELAGVDYHFSKSLADSQHKY